LINQRWLQYNIEPMHEVIQKWNEETAKNRAYYLRIPNIEILDILEQGWQTHGTRKDFVGTRSFLL